MNGGGIASAVWDFAKRAVTDAVRICLDLFRVMIPVIIVVKALKEFGLISYLAAPLAPAPRRKKPEAERMPDPPGKRR